MDIFKLYLRDFYRCIVTPAHGMMLAGFIIDHGLLMHDPLCMSSLRFDADIFFHMLSGCPAMCVGMFLGVAYECTFSSIKRTLLSGVIVLAVGFLSMYYGKAIYPMSAFAPLYFMMASMIGVGMAMTAVKKKLYPSIGGI